LRLFSFGGYGLALVVLGAYDSYPFRCSLEILIVKHVSERHKLNAEAMALKRQNEELQLLLANYVTQNVSKVSKLYP